MEKTKEIIDYLKFSTKLRVLRYAKDCGKNKDACEVFGVTFTRSNSLGILQFPEIVTINNHLLR
jgi:hypothetical protein